LAVGYCLLGVGCVLLAFGYWLLAIGCWLLAVGCWLLAGYWVLGRRKRVNGGKVRCARKEW